MSFLTLKDLSGVNTGYHYEENFRTRRYSLKRDSTEIVLGPDGYKVQRNDDLGEMNNKQANPDVAIFSQIIDDFRDGRYTHVKPGDIWYRAGQLAGMAHLRPVVQY